MPSRMSALRAAIMLTRSGHTLKLRAEKVVETAIQNLRAVAACMPDDEDELAEKVHWVAQWDICSATLVGALERASALGVKTLLSEEASDEFAIGDDFAETWRKDNDDDADNGDDGKIRTASRTSDNINETTETDGAKEGRTMAEPKVQRTETVSTLSRGSSKTGVAIARKRPLAATRAGNEDEATIVHDELCAKCAANGEPCKGVPGRACETCISLHHKCEKSGGRGSYKNRGEKGKAKEHEVNSVCEPRVKRRRFIEPIEVSDDGDDDEALKPKAKTKARPVAVSTREVVEQSCRVADRSSFKAELKKVRIRVQLAQQQHEKGAVDLKRMMEMVEAMEEELLRNA